MKKVSTEEQYAGLTISASNIVSDSIHRDSTNLLQVTGTISIPLAAEMGQSWTNKDHSRAHKNLVTGQKSKKIIYSKKGVYSEGKATNLCPELRQSLTEASMEYVPKHKKNMKEWMRWKFETHQRNERTKVETEATNTGEGNVVILYFFTNINRPVYGKQ